MSRLAIFICGLRLFQIEVGKGYGLAKWREDLKRLYWQTVIDNSTVGFVLGDT